jgi:drug/metabolite transporter (DMT)-like permease
VIFMGVLLPRTSGWALWCANKDRTPSEVKSQPSRNQHRHAALLFPGMSRGIAYALIAGLLFACMDAASKTLAQDYSVLQILLVRFLPLALISAWFATRHRVHGLSTRHFWLQMLRSLLFVTEIGIFISAIRILPLADAHAVLAVAPLIVTALSVPLLGEQVGIRRWTAVGVAFVGVLIILRPGIAVLEPVSMLPLIAAFMWALYQVLTRIVGRADPPLTTLFYSVIIGTIGLTLLAPFFWQAPEPFDWLLLAFAALAGAGGHYLLIMALQLTPAAILQPLSYMLLVWVTLVGFVVFGDLPDWPTVLGAVIIVASGLYVVARERSLAQRSA